MIRSMFGIIIELEYCWIVRCSLCLLLLWGASCDCVQVGGHSASDIWRDEDSTEPPSGGSRALGRGSFLDRSAMFPTWPAESMDCGPAAIWATAQLLGLPGAPDAASASESIRMLADSVAGTPMYLDEVERALLFMGGHTLRRSRLSTVTLVDYLSAGWVVIALGCWQENCTVSHYVAARGASGRRVVLFDSWRQEPFHTTVDVVLRFAKVEANPYDVMLLVNRRGADEPPHAHSGVQ